MQWVTSASLLFPWFPFRANTPVMMVKNTLPPPPNNAMVYKYGSENIHVCGALSLWVYFDSSFNKIQVIPFPTQYLLTLYALCFADATREALWRWTCWQEQEKTTLTVNKSITPRGSLNSQQWPSKLGGHMAWTGKGMTLLIILWYFLL